MGYKPTGLHTAFDPNHGAIPESGRGKSISHAQDAEAQSWTLTRNKMLQTQKLVGLQFFLLLAFGTSMNPL